MNTFYWSSISRKDCRSSSVFCPLLWLSYNTTGDRSAMVSLLRVCLLFFTASVLQCSRAQTTNQGKWYSPSPVFTACLYLTDSVCPTIRIYGGGTVYVLPVVICMLYLVNPRYSWRAFSSHYIWSMYGVCEWKQLTTMHALGPWQSRMMYIL